MGFKVVSNPNHCRTLGFSNLPTRAGHNPNPCDTSGCGSNTDFSQGCVLSPSSCRDSPGASPCPLPELLYLQLSRSAELGRAGKSCQAGAAWAPWNAPIHLLREVTKPWLGSSQHGCVWSRELREQESPGSATKSQRVPEGWQTSGMLLGHGKRDLRVQRCSSADRDTPSVVT